MNKDTHWIVTLILQIKINSIPYILKFIFFCGIVFVIHMFSSDFVTKVLSIITYVAGICIDCYFLNKQTNTENKKLEFVIFIYMILIWAGTVAAVLLLITATINQSFVGSAYYSWCNWGVNVFVLFATAAPLLEAIINCNGNQLTNKIGG